VALTYSRLPDQAAVIGESSAQKARNVDLVGRPHKQLSSSQAKLRVVLANLTEIQDNYLGYAQSLWCRFREKDLASLGNFAQILSTSPLIVFTSINDHRLPLGLASAIGAKLADRRATFVLSPAWSLEAAGGGPNILGRNVRRHAVAYQRRFQKHSLIIACNTTRESEIMEGAGLQAHLINKNTTVSEKIFRPLQSETIEFDAVYNARFHRVKRHFLAEEIERVAYIGYCAGRRQDLDYALGTIASIRAREPRHRIFNEFADRLPEWMAPDKVNAVYNRAAVGLCLSAIEGANVASMEYLLAGLPVVSTHNRGGRDVFFDPEYCLSVRPDPRAVRDAVDALKARAIPRDYVRARSLAKVQRARARFLDLLNECLTRDGSKSRFGPEWPFLDQPKLGGWATVRDHSAQILGQLERDA